MPNDYLMLTLSIPSKCFLYNKFSLWLDLYIGHPLQRNCTHSVPDGIFLAHFLEDRPAPNVFQAVSVLVMPSSWSGSERSHLEPRVNYVAWAVNKPAGISVCHGGVFRAAARKTRWPTGPGLEMRPLLKWSGDPYGFLVLTVNKVLIWTCLPRRWSKCFQLNSVEVSKNIIELFEWNQRKLTQRFIFCSFEIMFVWVHS